MEWRNTYYYHSWTYPYGWPTYYGNTLTYTDPGVKTIKGGDNSINNAAYNTPTVCNHQEG